MRSALAVGLLVSALAIGAGPSRAQPAGEPERWRLATDVSHASCLRDALPDTPLAVDLSGDGARVTIVVAPDRCAYVIDRLLAYGIEEVEVGGRRRGLVDLDRACGVVPASDPRFHATRAYDAVVDELWETFEIGARADELGSVDIVAARQLAARCPSMMAAARNPPGASLAALGDLRRRTFTHGAWSGTLAELERLWCPRLDDAARRIGARAATHARLGPGRRDVFTLSPEGFYVPGGSRPTLATRPLLRAKVWIMVEDTTLVDSLDGNCPRDASAATTYTRFTFAGDALIDRRYTTVCAPFDRAHVR